MKVYNCKESITLRKIPSTKAEEFCQIPLGEKVLLEIGNDPANGIFGFNAKMTLKVWQDQGELNMYQKQNTKTKRIYSLVTFAEWYFLNKEKQ